LHAWVTLAPVLLKVVSVVRSIFVVQVVGDVGCSQSNPPGRLLPADGLLLRHVVFSLPLS